MLIVVKPDNGLWNSIGLASTAADDAAIRQVCEMLNASPRVCYSAFPMRPYFITDHKIRFVLRETRFSWYFIAGVPGKASEATL